MRPRVLVESPYAGDLLMNVAYARACMLDSLMRGEAPFLSHLLYPQALDDTDPQARATGIEAGLTWGRAAEKTAVYTDLGISKGMRIGIESAREHGREIEFRSLGSLEDIVPVRDDLRKRAYDAECEVASLKGDIEELAEQRLQLSLVLLAFFDTFAPAGCDVEVPGGVDKVRDLAEWVARTHVNEAVALLTSEQVPA